MKLPVVNHQDYVAKINDDNKFPIRKFGELANYLINQKIVDRFYKPDYCSEETLSRAHSLEYITSIKKKTIDTKSQKKIGFPINDSVVNRSFRATGGTVLASKLAIDHRIACNTAGGSHHATYNEGAGYCVFNDVAVATRYLQSKGYVKNVLIVDLDVHQGNGTSDIFKNDKSVFTFSMHCKSNYPAKKNKGDFCFVDDSWFPHLSMELIEISNIVINFGSAAIEECVMLDTPIIDFNIKPFEKIFKTLYAFDFAMNFESNFSKIDLMNAIHFLLKNNFSDEFAQARKKQLFSKKNNFSSKFIDYVVA